MLHRRLMVATGVATVAVAAGAAQASAYQVYPSATAVSPWSAGTNWTAIASGGVQLKGADGATVVTCTSGGLGGAVNNSDGVALLDVVGGGFGSSLGGCSQFGQTLGASLVNTWTIGVVGGAGAPVRTMVSNVRLRIRCPLGGTNLVEYTGTLQSDFTGSVAFTNAPASSALTLTAAGPLVKLGIVGNGCPMLPSPLRMTANYVVNTVDGSPVSASNNLVVKP